MIPSKLCLEAVLVSSPCLRAESCVLGTVPTLGLEIAPFLNHYQVTHSVDQDLSTCPMHFLSRCTPLLTVDLNSLTRDPLRVRREGGREGGREEREGGREEREGSREGKGREGGRRVKGGCPSEINHIVLTS